MTNTIYHNLYRDDVSVSSSDVSQQLNIIDEHNQQPSSSSSFYSVISRAINALRFQRSGLHPRDTRNDENGYGSSSASVSSTLQLEGEILEAPNLMTFSFKELKSATRNFSSDTLLGEGGFGKVFKGWVDGEKLTATKPGRGIALAVKILNHEGFQGHKEWLAEIVYLGSLYHPHLVKLFGYGLDGEDRLLTYEFMPRGSLNNHLFRSGSSSSSLSWSLRMRIALGAAKGIAFLHRADVNVIHRGVQCSNILLDSDFNAKLSDFGLARDGPTDGMSHVSTRVMGTYGYAAPEYIATGHLTSQCDVYGFGVVLLEMLTGRRVDKRHPPKEQNLLDWAKPCLNDTRVSRIMDSCLDGRYPHESCRKVAKLTLKCLNVNPKLRPNMVEVVTILEQIQEC